MKSFNKQEILNEDRLAFKNDKTLPNDSTSGINKEMSNMDCAYKRMAKIVDFLLAITFMITIVGLCIAAVAWLFGKVAPWPIFAVMVIVLLLIRLLNHK
jgi:hypothetical protein